jgi:hypothetical protein
MTATAPFRGFHFPCHGSRSPKKTRVDVRKCRGRAAAVAVIGQSNNNTFEIDGIQALTNEEAMVGFNPEATVDDHDGRRANDDGDGDDDDDDDPLLASGSLLGGRFRCERMCLSIVCRCVTIPTIIILTVVAILLIAVFCIVPGLLLVASVVTFNQSLLQLQSRSDPPYEYYHAL